MRESFSEEVSDAVDSTLRKENNESKSSKSQCTDSSLDESKRKKLTSGGSYDDEVFVDTFPVKLFSLLKSESVEIVEWLPHGESFRIKDNDKFCNGIISKYFKQTKISSFQRQLNLYGFKRILKGADKGAYFHAHFHRDRPEDIINIKRIYTNKKDDDMDDEIRQNLGHNGMSHNSIKSLSNSANLNPGGNANMMHPVALGLLNPMNQQYANPNDPIQMDYLSRYLHWNNNFIRNGVSVGNPNMMGVGDMSGIGIGQTPSYDASGFRHPSTTMNLTGLSNGLTNSSNPQTTSSSSVSSDINTMSYDDYLQHPHKSRRREPMNIPLHLSAGNINGNSSSGNLRGMYSHLNNLGNNLNSVASNDDLFQYQMMLQQQQQQQQQLLLQQAQQLNNNKTSNATLTTTTMTATTNTISTTNNNTSNIKFNDRQILEKLELNHQQFFHEQQNYLEHLKNFFNNFKGQDNKNNLDPQILEVMEIMEERHKQFCIDQQQFYQILKK